MMINTPLHANEDVTVDISIIGQYPQFDNERPIIVAGVWHTISFNEVTEFTNEATLTMYQGVSIPTDKDNTNYYQWEYNPANDNPWQPINSYAEGTIKNSHCQKFSDGITFCIGIPDHLPDVISYSEQWMLELTISKNTVFKESFSLEKPTKGFAKSHGDYISFSVDPFSQMKSSASDYVTLKNTGNVPLNISINYKQLDNLLTYSDSSSQIPAHSKQNYKLVLNSLSWKPQQIQQRGTATASVSSYYLLDQDVSGTAISLQTALVLDVPTINIFVGHNNFEITTLDPVTGFSFQHQRMISMHEGETRILNAYLSGDGSATVSVNTNDNITLLQITKNGEQTEFPITVISSNAEEQVISLKIKALSENKDGIISYSVETEDGTKTFTTRINVGPPAVTEEPSPIVGVTSPVTLVVLLALILAAGYMLYNHLVYGRGERR